MIDYETIETRIARGNARYSFNAEFKEEDHPRAEDGKFGKGGGGSGGTGDSKKKGSEIKSKTDVSPDMAKTILRGEEDIPDGWYVHGRSKSQKFGESEHSTQFTRDIGVANQYAGTSGAVWMVKPSDDARIVDFTGKGMDEFVDNLSKVFDEKKEEYPFPEIISNIAQSKGIDDSEVDFDVFEGEVRAEFNPKDIVDSAGAFDNDEWMYLLGYACGTDGESYPDFIETYDGAVMVPGAENIESVNLTDLAKEEKQNSSPAIKVYRASIRKYRMNP